jgi:hypothetical protein
MSWEEVGKVEVEEEIKKRRDEEVEVQEVEDGEEGIVEDPNRLGCK